ncbi:MAG: epoxyqueuosine reductase QueH [Tissierellia bacterium]|nr:epoxyqueuosine reductase QueH [Tissierellia bacterium]
MKVNYQNKMEEILGYVQTQNKVFKLLLHSCCGPCSTYVLEYLSEYFEILLLYFNPNIYPSEEYFFREREQRELIQRLDPKHPIHMLSVRYQPEEYYDAVRGLEDTPEGGSRCEVCFRLRLTEAAKAAQSEGAEYFTTTLSISPHKNAQLLNRLGEEIGEEYGIQYLYSDFKKKGGFLRSVQLTEQLGMYRQDYCGCEFSKRRLEE